MDIGAANIVGVIVDSAGEYLVTYSPLFIFIASLVLALAVIGALIDKLYPDSDTKKSENE